MTIRGLTPRTLTRNILTRVARDWRSSGAFGWVELCADGVPVTMHRLGEHAPQIGPTTTLTASFKEPPCVEKVAFYGTLGGADRHDNNDLLTCSFLSLLDMACAGESRPLDDVLKSMSAAAEDDNVQFARDVFRQHRYRYAYCAEFVNRRAELYKTAVDACHHHSCLCKGPALLGGADHPDCCAFKAKQEGSTLRRKTYNEAYITANAAKWAAAAERAAAERAVAAAAINGESRPTKRVCLQH